MIKINDLSKNEVVARNIDLGCSLRREKGHCPKWGRGSPNTYFVYDKKVFKDLDEQGFCYYGAFKFQIINKRLHRVLIDANGKQYTASYTYY